MISSAFSAFRVMDDGAFQYGPLHVYLVAGALALGIDREDAGRWVSLIFGVLSVFPLWSLSRRLGGLQAAWWATAGLALWGMHIQMSTTAGSESVGLFFVLWSLALLAEGLEENRFPPLFGSALVLNLACAVRYDCWLLIPLICVLLLLGDRDRVAAVTRSVCYGLLSIPFVLSVVSSTSNPCSETARRWATSSDTVPTALSCMPCELGS